MSHLVHHYHLHLLLLFMFAFLIPKSTASTRTLNRTKCLTDTELDLLMARQYTFGTSGRKFPEKLSQFKQYCKESTHMNEQLMKYVTNCVSDSFTRHSLAIVARTVRRELRILCRKLTGKPTRAQNRLMLAGRCSNTVRAEQQQCLDLAIRYFQDSSQIRVGREKIQFMCCNVNNYEDCLRRSMQDRAQCPEAASVATIELIRTVLSNSMDFACGDSGPETDRCDRFRGLPPNAPKAKYKSFVLPFIDTMQHVDA